MAELTKGTTDQQWHRIWTRFIALVVMLIEHDVICSVSLVNVIQKSKVVLVFIVVPTDRSLGSGHLHTTVAAYILRWFRI